MKRTACDSSGKCKWFGLDPVACEFFRNTEIPGEYNDDRCDFFERQSLECLNEYAYPENQEGNREEDGV